MTAARSRFSTPARLRRYLQVLECRYPHAWDHLDTLRQARSRIAPWPVWCHVPLTTAHDLVVPEGATQDLTRLVDVAIVAGLGAWRASQDIYQVARAELTRERSFDVDLDVAPQHLQTMLQRAVYLDLPDTALRSTATGSTRGAFAHLEYDPRTRLAELRLLIEPSRRWTLGSVPLIPAAVPLTEPTLGRCLDAAVRHHVHRHERLDRFAVAGEMAVAMHGLVQVFAGLLVHLLDPARMLPEASDLAGRFAYTDTGDTHGGLIGDPVREHQHDLP